MINRIKVVDVELSHSLADVDGLSGYTGLRCVVRLHGRPVGYVDAPLVDGRCDGETLRSLILRRLGRPLIFQLLRNLVAGTPRQGGWSVADLAAAQPPSRTKQRPLVTVAVCTRDRPDDLRRCLESLTRVDYAPLDVLVVDNAPSNDATERVVGEFPAVRYEREPRPGLDWARNRAIAEARGEILAYADDDTVVDPDWVAALVDVFVGSEETMAVTGLVVPDQLETEAQILFERYGGLVDLYRLGFERQWFNLRQERQTAGRPYLTGNYGAGANMAFRRELFNLVGVFDPALDVGTPTNGGGDLEIFFRVLKEGQTLVYEPAAVVRHTHRRVYDQLHQQVTNFGIGYDSFLVRTALAYPEERRAILFMGLSWGAWMVRRLIRLYLRPKPDHPPRDLALAEFKGALIGLRRYHQARHRVARTEPFHPAIASPRRPSASAASPRSRGGRPPDAVAVRTIDLDQPLQGLSDVTDYAMVRVVVVSSGCPLGQADIINDYQPISAMRFGDAIAYEVGIRLLGRHHHLSTAILQARTTVAVASHSLRPGSPIAASTELIEFPTTESRPRLLPDVSVSVVITTRDRPDDLRDCLRHLLNQDTARAIEVVVVDRHAASGLTPPVIAEFPDVKLLNEPRRGRMYARNVGFAASQGEIIVSIDDIVAVPTDWLEKLLAPFVDSAVAVVTGNCLAKELEEGSQFLFDRHVRMRCGFEPQRVNAAWLRSFRGRAAPCWELGTLTNAAFRAQILGHPALGLTEGAFGSDIAAASGGTDAYFFYRVLRSGFVLVYQPAAYVWYRPEREMSALRRFVYAEGKSQVAYQLTTLLRDRDLRAIPQVAYYLPRKQVWNGLRHLKRNLAGRRDYAVHLILLEIAGNIAGPWVLFRSWWEARRPANERSIS